MQGGPIVPWRWASSIVVGPHKVTSCHEQRHEEEDSNSANKVAHCLKQSEET